MISNILPLLVLLLSVFLVRRTHGIFNIFSPASYFFLMHLVLYYLAIFYRIIYQHSVPIDDSTINVIVSGFFVFTLGVVMVDTIFSRFRKPKMILETCSVWKDTGVRLSASDRIAALVVLGLGIIGVVLFIWKSGTIFWLEEHSDDLRIESRKGFGWLTIASIVMITFGAITYSVDTLFRRKYIASFSVFFLGFVAILMFGNRGPAFELIVLYGFIFIARMYGKIPISIIVSGVLSILIFLGLLGMLRQGKDMESMSIILNSLWRPFVNIQNIDIILNKVPSEIPFQYGKGFLTDLAVLAPGYQPNFATWIKEALGMTFSGGGLTITYHGDLYANFGYPGLYIGSFVWGAILSMISRFCFPKNLNSLIYLALFSMSLKGVVSSGFIPPVLYNLLPILVVIVLYRSISLVLQTASKPGDISRVSTVD